MRHTEDQVMRLITASLLLTAADRAPGGLRKTLTERATRLLAEVDDRGVTGTEFDGYVGPARQYGVEEYPLRHHQPQFTEELYAAGDSGGPAASTETPAAPAGANGPAEPTATAFAG